MAQLAIGVSFLSRKAARTSPDVVPALLNAFTAASWQRPLRYFSGIVDAPKAPPRRPGVLKPKTLRDELQGLLTSDALTSVTMQTSARNDEQFSTLTVETVLRPHYTFARLHGYHHADERTLADLDAWVGDMLACAEAIDAEQGVICVMSEDGAAAEVSLVGRSHNGKDLHPFPAEFERMRWVERELGTTYVRFPRWGTLLARDHIDALGGLARLIEVVEPARVRESPRAIYLQLTDSVAGALEPATAAKQHAFTMLASPLLPAPGART